MLQPGDILLIKTKGIYAKLIRWWTNSKYTHVAIVLTENIAIEANWRVRTFPIDDINNYDIYRLKGGLTNKEQNEIRKKLLYYHGRRYDFLQITGYLFMSYFKGRNKFNSSKYVICSELADRVYHSIGYNLLPNIYLGDATPGDIAKSNYLERID
ncbi:MAG: hypothetical protein ACOCRK_03040 [bacterium]